MSAVCQSSCAGYWYPANAAELRELLFERFGTARAHSLPLESGVDAGFVVPHAAPLYSGKVAAAAYTRLTELHPRRVLILGFCHSGAHPGIAIPPFDTYRTPLGDIALDLQAIDSLLGQPCFQFARVSDHSVEVQLPFLQLTAPEACIVPLFVGQLNVRERETAATALIELLTNGTVLIASSDFTHYGRSFGFVPFPLDSETPRRIREQDMETIRAIAALDLPEYRERLRRCPESLCGDFPVSLLIETLRRFRTHVVSHILDYAQSGEMTGDYRQSVSYAALAFSAAPESWTGRPQVEIGLV